MSEILELLRQVHFWAKVHKLDESMQELTQTLAYCDGEATEEFLDHIRILVEEKREAVKQEKW